LKNLRADNQNMYSDLKAMAGNEEGLQIQVLNLRAKKNDLEA